jgi:peptide-methionine (S)-S-oxide reductase
MKVLQLPGYIAFILALSINACAQPQKKETTKQKPQIKSSSMGTETITFGSGCFWCTEAIFQQVKGVEKVVSGYSGGHVVNPTYEQVCEKNTGHAEVCQLTFDPSQVSVDELLEIFWQTHDPTTLNQQGNDIGPQYRSVVFYHNENQKERAEFFLNELSKSGAFEKPIVTTIEPYKNFYKAENYHQNYYNQNGSQPYCYFVIRPKVEKFEKAFKDKMKPKQ